MGRTNCITVDVKQALRTRGICMAGRRIVVRNRVQSIENRMDPTQPQAEAGQRIPDTDPNEPVAPTQMQRVRYARGSRSSAPHATCRDLGEGVIGAPLGQCVTVRAIPMDCHRGHADRVGDTAHADRRGACLFEDHVCGLGAGTRSLLRHHVYMCTDATFTMQTSIFRQRLLGTAQPRSRKARRWQPGLLPPTLYRHASARMYRQH